LDSLLDKGELSRNKSKENFIPQCCQNKFFKKKEKKKKKAKKTSSENTNSATRYGLPAP
jgi:rRNA-processing protein FCF1